MGASSFSVHSRCWCSGSLTGVQIVVVVASLLLFLSAHQPLPGCDAFPRGTIQSKPFSTRGDSAATTGLEIAPSRRRRRRRNVGSSTSSTTPTTTTTSSSFPLTRIVIRPYSLHPTRERTDDYQEVESSVESHQDATVSSLQKIIEQSSPTLLQAPHQVVAGTVTKEESKSGSTRSLLALSALTLWGGCIGGAWLNIVPGYWNDVFQVARLGQDLGASVCIGALAYAFVQLNTYAVSVNRLPPRDARKIIHTCSAPLYMMFWPLFSGAPGARVFCAVVPLLNALRLVWAATGSTDRDGAAVGEQDLAVAVSRSGNVREALGGPFIYVGIMALATLLFWRDTPVGVTALSILAAGDGMADLVGRRWGKHNKWPHYPDKSMAGSLAFLVAGSVTATALLAWLQYAGCLVLPFAMPQVAWTVVAIAFVSAAIEVVPASWLWGIDDNYSVPLTAALLSFLWLR